MARSPGVVPVQRFRRGDLETAWRPDPERPMRDHDGTQVGYHQVQGFRVRTGARYLLARGTITADHAAVADRYVETVERMHGGSDVEAGEGVRTPLHQRGHPTEAQLAAAELLRLAIAGVGNGPMGLIGAVMLDGATLAALSVLYDEPEKSVAGRLRAALERLGEVWG